MCNNTEQQYITVRHLLPVAAPGMPRILLDFIEAVGPFGERLITG